MLEPLSNLTGYKIHAVDGNIGKVDEFYFDDTSWAIRYLIAKTGSWFNDREVLLSVVALGTPDWMTLAFPVNLTREQVRNSPDVDTEFPIYRHHEIALHSYYQWPFYWDGAFPDTYSINGFTGDEFSPLEDETSEQQTEKAHIQSTRYLMGRPLKTNDGEIGHVEDFIVNTDTWVLTDIIVTTGIWHFGKKVLIPVELVESIDNSNEIISLNCSKEDIRNHRGYDPLEPVEEQEEIWVNV